MMRHRSVRLVFLVLPLLLPITPVQAQEADTTAMDTTRAGPTSADTAQTAGATDSLAADTVQSMDLEPAQAKEQARAAAASWLTLTDDGKFGESWDAAASVLQEAITRQGWIKQGNQARSRLDSLKSRELTRVQYRDSTTQISTGSPIVTLEYRSEFNADSALEAVITTTQDGEWKVAGYRIVPVPKTNRELDSTAVEADSTSQQ